MLTGIDVSAWQPKNITGIVPGDFALIKATEGTSYVSPYCDPQYQAAVGSGKLVGVYHFASGGDANAEATHFYQNIKGYIGQAVLVLDFEAGAVSRGGGWARQFLDKLYALSGVRGVIYTSGSVAAQGHMRTVAAGNYGLWVASWGNNPVGGYGNAPASSDSGVWPFAIMRQFSSNGELPGYAGRLDLDVFYGDKNTWMAYAAKDGQPAAPPASTIIPAGHSLPVGRNASTMSTAEIQRIVGAGVDGIYGPETTAKVKAWESAHGLAADGIFGPKCQATARRSGGLVVDGIYGPKTCKAEQRALGVAVDGKRGPQTISAEQRRTGARVDGIDGPDTDSHLQRYLVSKGFSVGPSGIDGKRGHDTIVALQQALNAGKF